MTESVYMEVLKNDNLYNSISSYLNYNENNEFSLIDKKTYEFYLNKKHVKAINLSSIISSFENKSNKNTYNTYNNYNNFRNVGNNNDENNYYENKYEENIIITIKKLMKKHKGVIKAELNVEKNKSLKLLLLLPQIEELKLTITSVADCFIFKNLKKLNNLTLILNPDQTYQYHEQRSKEFILINYLKSLQKLTIIANDTDKLNYLKFDENNTVTELVYIIDTNINVNFERIKIFKNLKYLEIKCKNDYCLSNINFLNELKNLEKLSLDGFENLDFRILKGLNKLKSLSLCFDEEPNLSFLKDTCLEELSIEVNGEFEFDLNILNEIKSLKKVTILYLYQNDLFFLVNLSDLEYINLSENGYIVDFAPIKYLNDLKVLLENCKLIDINFITGLNKLEIIDLTENKNIDDYKPIKKIKMLKINI